MIESELAVSHLCHIGCKCPISQCSVTAREMKRGAFFLEEPGNGRQPVAFCSYK